MVSRKFWLSMGLVCLLLVSSVPGKAFAQDDFTMPADGASGASGASGGEAASGAKPDDTPANPEEAPGAPPADSGGGGGADAGGDGGAKIPANLEEPEHVEMLAANHKFNPGKPSKDPFRPLVEKKVVLPPVAPPPTSAGKPSAPPPPPPPKPIQLFVSGICGNDADRLAMITFENKTYTVQKDQVVEGKFKVVDILNDRVVVYSNKEQMRRTFPIGGGKD